MDNTTREVLSFLARMIVRQENNNGIPVPDMDRLKRIGDGTAFEEEPGEIKMTDPVLELRKDNPNHIKIDDIDCYSYVTKITRELTNYFRGEPVYHIEICLEADGVLLKEPEKGGGEVT